MIFAYIAVELRLFKRCHDRRRHAQCLLHDTTTFSSILTLVKKLWVGSFFNTEPYIATYGLKYAHDVNQQLQILNK